MVTITFLTPYTQQWLTETLPTMEQALARIRFYQSCGSPAHVVSWSDS